MKFRFLSVRPVDLGVENYGLLVFSVDLFENSIAFVIDGLMEILH